MSRVTLVTGANGHLGAALVRALLTTQSPPTSVRVLIHRVLSPSLEGLALEQFHGDVRDPASLDKAFEGVDVVYNLAAKISYLPTEDAEVLRTNTEGPRNVAAACLKHGVRRMVHTSSIHALRSMARAGESRRYTDETCPAGTEDSRPAYDRSKAMGEGEVMAAVARGLDAVVVNPTGVIGPYDFFPQNMGRALLKMYHGRVPTSVEGGFNWVDVRDVADGLMGAERAGRKGERYLLAGHWASMGEVFRLVEKVTGHRAPRITLPVWVARLGVPFAALWAHITNTRPMYTHESLGALEDHHNVSNAKAMRELGFTSRPLEDTLRDAFTFWEAVGLLEKGDERPGRRLPIETPVGNPAGRES